MVNLCFIVMVSLYINVSGIKNTNKGHWSAFFSFLLRPTFFLLNVCTEKAQCETEAVARWLLRPSASSACSISQYPSLSSLSSSSFSMQLLSSLIQSLLSELSTWFFRKFWNEKVDKWMAFKGMDSKVSYQVSEKCLFVMWHFSGTPCIILHNLQGLVWLLCFLVGLLILIWLMFVTGSCPSVFFNS